ncbi:hypothetical protein [Sinomonas mesophila]|uniref:hypothetical protein n=1 Tax=Sinomonas mesophila TaxID=1531955 RepID=UPI0009840C6E|nr:hypothetical protein [Sinomonas mesophila]
MDRILAAVAGALRILAPPSHSSPQSPAPIESHPYSASLRLVATPWEGLHLEPRHGDGND